MMMSPMKKAPEGGACLLRVSEPMQSARLLFTMKNLFQLEGGERPDRS